jgi:hypothetical protein
MVRATWPTMTARAQDWHQRIARDGFLVLPGVFGSAAVAAMLEGLARAFASRQQGAIRSEAGSLYAARNVLSLWPEVATAWRQTPLPEALAAILGACFGLVRTLFFDKPPDGTWALPWHKDVTIAVRDNRLPSQRFAKPTLKAGVPHVEAPVEILNSMLTARIHLDDVTEENGPLKVIPGSHHTGADMRLGDIAPETITVGCGDVLLMRPLLAHSSGRSHPETRRHRRVLHLEFAASSELPDGYAWHDFRPGLE